MTQMLAIIQQTTENISTAFPEWLLAGIIAMKAGTLSKKQKRKFRWKLFWQTLKSKFRFGKKAKSEKKGLGILALLLALGCVGLIILLGGGTLLIILGVIVIGLILIALSLGRSHL